MTPVSRPQARRFEICQLGSEGEIAMQSDLHWVGTWTTAPAPAEGAAFSNHTLRMNIRASIGGGTLRVRPFHPHCSRQILFGAAPAWLRGTRARLVPGSPPPPTLCRAAATAI